MDGADATTISGTVRAAAPSAGMTMAGE